MPLINADSLNSIYLRDLIKICGTHPPRRRPMARLLPRDRREIKPGARYTYIYLPLALLVRRRRRPIKSLRLLPLSSWEQWEPIRSFSRISHFDPSSSLFLLLFSPRNRFVPCLSAWPIIGVRRKTNRNVSLSKVKTTVN